MSVNSKLAHAMPVLLQTRSIPQIVDESHKRQAHVCSFNFKDDRPDLYMKASSTPAAVFPMSHSQIHLQTTSHDLGIVKKGRMRKQGAEAGKLAFHPTFPNETLFPWDATEKHQKDKDRDYRQNSPVNHAFSLQAQFSVLYRQNSMQLPPCPFISLGFVLTKALLKQVEVRLYLCFVGFTP